MRIIVIHFQNDDIGHKAASWASTLGSYLHLGFIPIKHPNNNIDVTHGFTSNGEDVTFVNCDGNPTSHLVLYANMANAAPPAHRESQAIVGDWLKTIRAVASENYLEPVDDYLFSGQVSVTSNLIVRMYRFTWIYYLWV